MSFAKFFRTAFVIGCLLRCNKTLVILTIWKPCSFNFTSVNKKFLLN